MIKIAVDAMGGDFAPAEIVMGAVDGARNFECEVFLVGDEVRIRKFYTKFPTGTNCRCGLFMLRKQST